MLIFEWMSQLVALRGYSTRAQGPPFVRLGGPNVLLGIQPPYLSVKQAL